MGYYPSVDGSPAESASYRELDLVPPPCIDCRIRDLLVLCYHAVSPTWPAALSVPPEALEGRLASLVRRGYRGATFTDALAHRGKDRLLVVTFDDAYRSVLDRALPILSRLGLPGTLFVPTDYIDAGGLLAWPGTDRWLAGPHASELVGLNWGEIASLMAEGWEVGSHTRSHPRLTQIADARLEDELAGSREVCEDRLSTPCRSLAYPYGDVDERVVDAARRAGFEAAATLPKRLDVRGPLEWPRVGIYQGDSRWRFELKVSPHVRRVRASRAWLALEPLRSRVGSSSAVPDRGRNQYG